MFSIRLLCLFAFIAVCAAYTEKEYQSMFTQWAQRYRKSYNHEEYRSRYAVFKGNVDLIEEHNAKNSTYTMRVNSLADLTTQEYRRLLLGVKWNGKFNRTSVKANGGRVDALPTSWDWRPKGAVTPIKNQQQCGSCWSFSTTGSVEGCHKIAGKTLVSLSEQNLMDCSDSYGNQGCNGGLMTQAMQYIIDNGGIDTESSYPYTAEDGTCSYSAANSGATLSSFTNVNQYDENDLQTKNYAGPVSVAIDASHSSFQFYSSGVYNEPDCSQDQLDHGVLAVGWGVSSGSNYWIVKNSWGTDWGMSGYIWMTRGSNQCGIATMATLPQGC